MANLVFVYGSLLEGLFNNRLLQAGNAKLVARTFTTQRFKMYDLGAFPACVPDERGTCIHGEVYSVDDATLARLDRLEGYDPERGPGLYDRITVHVGGKMHALMYVMHRPRGSATVDTGDWRTYFELREGSDYAPVWAD